MDSSFRSRTDVADTIEGKARARDGTGIAFTVHKGNSAKRLVLIHSLAMDRSFWNEFVAEIGTAADILVFDCRGHGRSDKPDQPYSVELFADDLADLLDHVGWRSATVAGASMGGCVSLAFAAAYPDRTEALGLIDTTAYYGDDAPKQWAQRAERALAEGMSGLVEFQKVRWFSDSFRECNPDVLERSLQVFLANDPRAYSRTCRMLGACDKRSALPSLDMPAAILVGEEDYATPVAMAEEMQRAMPRAHLLVIPKARHFTPLEEPDLVAREVQALMAAAGRR